MRYNAAYLYFQAYKQGLYGSNHVWILAGPIVYENWIGRNKDADASVMGCTYDQLIEATNGHFTLNYARIDAQNPKTISDQVSKFTFAFEYYVLCQEERGRIHFMIPVTLWRCYQGEIIHATKCIIFNVLCTRKKLESYTRIQYTDAIALSYTETNFYSKIASKWNQS